VDGEILAKRFIYNIHYLSDNNLFRLSKIAARYSQKKKGVKQLVNEKLIDRFYENVHPKIKSKVIRNFILRGIIYNDIRRTEILNQGSSSPVSVLISPSMRCNLNCIGCYAGKYTRQDDLDFETLSRVIREAQDMGTAFFTILGGEPLVYPRLFDMFKVNNNAFFQFYTNGTLINESTVKKLLEVGNAVPILSIEGFEERTDERRGKGTYQKLMKAMDLLRENHIPFGFSSMVTSKNAEEVTSDEFVDFLIRKGAYLGWYFLYMPIGKNPDLKLMPTPEQRRMMLDKVNAIRHNKPLFVVDFWNDAPLVGGCIAGKNYIHITHKGDVEPCIFTHFAMDNVKDKHLREVMDSQFFRELRKRQPYSDNLYLPCMWIDHPEVSRELKKQLPIYPTHPEADAVLVDESLKRGLDKYSERVKEIYQEAWEERERLINPKKILVRH